MRIHILQHAAYEGPGRIAAWAAAQGVTLSFTRQDRGEALPGHRDYDGLVALGGPMNVDEESRHPWLAQEKAFLAKAMALGRPTLGICLGAQLMAAALGAPVTRNPCREIGWHPLALSPQARSMHLWRDFPDRFTVFHWHGDTFAIPRHGVLVASSRACAHQGFVLGEHILGLQFHLETDAPALEAMLAAGADELPPAQPDALAGTGGFVQDEQAIRAQAGEHLPAMNQLCDRLLSRFFG